MGGLGHFVLVQNLSWYDLFSLAALLCAVVVFRLDWMDFYGLPS